MGNKRKKKRLDDSDGDSDSDSKPATTKIARLTVVNRKPPPKKPKQPAQKITKQRKVTEKTVKVIKRTEKTKRERPDVVKRKAKNADSNITIVKATLRSFCKKRARALPWAEVLKDMNKAILEAYVLANLHVVRLCEKGRRIPELNQSFFYQCLSAVTEGDRKKKAIENDIFWESVQLYNFWRGSDVERANSTFITSGWHNNISQQMATNASNSVETNFYRRFRRYLRHKYKLNGKQAYEMLKNILADVYNGDDKKVWLYRLQLPRDEKGQVSKAPHLLMPLQYKFLRYFESNHPVKEYTKESKQLRLFSLLPYKRGFECSHFKMCTDGLWALLKRKGLKIPDKNNGWRNVSNEWWTKLFRIKKFKSGDREFAGEILTDGKAVSIVFRKKKKEKVVPQEPSLKDFDVIWGLDPGRRDLFVATNQDGKKVSCSSKEYYEDAKFKHSGKKIKYWQEQNPDVLDAIRTMPTKKTATLNGLETYIKFLIPKMDMLLEFSMYKPFRDLKFKRYIFMQKKLQELCLKLTKEAGRKTVVGFGDWSNQDVGGFIKKCPAGPVKRFEKQLRRYCTVISIDEYNTSKVHAECKKKELYNQYSQRRCKDGEFRTLKVHSVLHCKFNGCYGMTVNRDDNASKNILHLTQLRLQGKDRPPAFCRTENVEVEKEEEKVSI